MLLGALLELHGDPAGFLARLNAAGIEDTNITAEPCEKCGIRGVRVSVKINGQEEGGHNGHKHAHGGYNAAERAIERLNIPASVKQNAIAVYQILADAESHVHGVPVDKIHFHEVGEKDAVADIVGVCMLIDELKPARVSASPINTGSGCVRCAHGVLPVPAPATAYILRGVPIYSGGETSELTTPTGAALLKRFAAEFTDMPLMTVSRIGYGMGKMNFDRVNCVRAFLGEAQGAAICESIVELVCNLDDQTPEAVSFARQTLFEAGAADVYTTPVVMKKNRAGVALTCMCHKKDEEKMLALIFRHTTTLGVRTYKSRRYSLRKTCETVNTPLGDINVKISEGFGVRKIKPEYDSVAQIARERDMTFDEVTKKIYDCYPSR